MLRFHRTRACRVATLAVLAITGTPYAAMRCVADPVNEAGCHVRSGHSHDGHGGDGSHATGHARAHDHDRERSSGGLRATDEEHAPKQHSSTCCELTGKSNIATSRTIPLDLGYATDARVIAAACFSGAETLLRMRVPVAAHDPPRYLSNASLRI